MTEGRRTDYCRVRKRGHQGAERHWDDSQGARVAEGNDGLGN